MSREQYELTPVYTAQEAMCISYISRSQFGLDWHSTVHTHSCCELFFCVEGRGQFNLQGELFNVCTNDLVVLNPYVNHTELSLPTHPLEYIVLGIENAEIQLEGGRDCAIVNCADNRRTILFYLEALLQEASLREESSPIVCRDLLEVLLIQLSRTRNLKVSSINAKRVSKECAQLRRYIDEHYSEPLTLDQLSAVTHISKYYLVHTFTKECGISPINYLIDRRIRESKYLLTNTDYTLAQIAHLLGFSSQSYFSQSFRKNSGLSPMEYRAQSRPAASESAPKSEKQPQV